MTTKLTPEQMPFWPAAMTQQMAAAYCGLSVDIFAKACPVQPISITRSRTGKRYLRARLDEWLMSLDNPGPPQRQGMGAMWRAAHEAERT